MISYYLRFPDEATGMAALRDAGFTSVDEDGAEQVVTASHSHALDVIGPIATGGEYDSETGDVITLPMLLPGWHVNYIGELPGGWDQYLVQPQNPARIWA